MTERVSTFRQSVSDAATTALKTETSDTILWNVVGTSTWRWE